MRRKVGFATAAISLPTVLLVALAGCSSDSDVETRQTPTTSGAAPITITFMRHAESAGNASGLIDTSVPGPSLTQQGRQEAQAAADEYGGHDYDGVYASTMVRTQQSAEPMSQAVGQPVEVIPGIQEIEAGDREGRPEAEGRAASPAGEWLMGNRNVRIPGSIDGNEFDRRFDAGVEKIYTSGDTHPIVFAHGGSIQMWVLMNVSNPDLSLMKTNPLPNTGSAVVTGSPAEGWRLVTWNGKQI